MKKFIIPCDFGGVSAPFAIYIGDPDPKRHPLHFQADWLSKNRGGVIPSDIMESVEKLYDLARKNRVSFQDLCVYALTENESKPSVNNTIEAPPVPSSEKDEEVSNTASDTDDFDDDFLDDIDSLLDDDTAEDSPLKDEKVNSKPKLDDQPPAALQSNPEEPTPKLKKSLPKPNSKLNKDIKTLREENTAKKTSNKLFNKPLPAPKKKDT